MRKRDGILKRSGSVSEGGCTKCGNFGIKTKMAVGTHANVFASLKSKY